MKDEFGEIDSVTCYGVDLSRREEIDDFVEYIRDEHGPVLHLINNAGVNMSGSIREVGLEEVEYSMSVNAYAPLQLMKGVLGDMVEREYGRIINVTSGAPLNCFAGYAPYSSSKAALNALTVTAAREHEDENIKINLMSPGPVETEMAPDAPMEPSACHDTADYLLSLDEEGPTGGFFWLGYEIPLTPDLEGVEWLEGEASDEYKNVL
jgi:NAD(P)-dependent dehydrogenase (short-subunit alcohol dehydrogenase family)